MNLEELQARIAELEGALQAVSAMFPAAEVIPDEDCDPMFRPVLDKVRAALSQSPPTAKGGEQ